MSHVSADSAPFLAVHGTLDPLIPIEQARRFVAALQQAGRPAYLLELPNEGHGLTDPADQTLFLSKASQFLATYLG